VLQSAPVGLLGRARIEGGSGASAVVVLRRAMDGRAAQDKPAAW